MVATVAARPGRLAMSVHPDTAADLQALHDRLATAGLSAWLVRHQRRVAVAIASSLPGTAVADAVLRMLADLRGDGFHWAQAASGIVRVGRSGDTSRWVELERWNIGAHRGTCARANALTREQFDAADVEPVTVELFGRRWPTLAGMFDAHTDDVGHDIDVVFSWVDGTDPAFLSCRAGWLARAVLGDGLAEHFLYCNDDMFFGRPVAPSMFFTPAGISRFIESPVRIGARAPGPGRSGPEVDETCRARTVSNFLAGYFPYPAPWEVEWTAQRDQPDDVSRCAA
jgi:hypothetical protein